MDINQIIELISQNDRKIESIEVLINKLKEANESLKIQYCQLPTDFEGLWKDEKEEIWKFVGSCADYFPNKGIRVKNMQHNYENTFPLKGFLEHFEKLKS